MGYRELIKNFEGVRDYMRQFYVYGFKSRSEYDAKSTRSYDNERRRIESWLGDYMSFRQDSCGKRVFLSVDSRAIPHNPLYTVFKARSFTDNDITLHFYLLDLLYGGHALPVKEIADQIASKYLSRFQFAKALDESTVRNKLKEYQALGIVRSVKSGRKLLYSLTESRVHLAGWREAVSFFSEADPLGVIGSFLLDQYPASPNHYCFKHHYILHALDSLVLCDLLLSMSEKRCAALTIKSPHCTDARLHNVYPLRIYSSTQTGRQYLLCYHYRFRKPVFFRLDSIHSVKQGAVEKQHAKYEGYCIAFQKNLWGVSTGVDYAIDHIEMKIHVEENEQFIVNRLLREKRCGVVEQIDSNTYRFSADVYDAAEMLPWLRTFIGRIEKLVCSDPNVTRIFYDDLAEMQSMYGGAEDAVQ